MMSDMYERVARSDQGNTYGGLNLVRATKAVQTDGGSYEVGDYFLEMEDCFGGDYENYTGPLTAEQVRAFHVLFGTGVKS